MTEFEEGPSFAEAVRGIWAATRGIWTAVLWFWERRRMVTRVCTTLTAIVLIGDQVAGPHFLREAFRHYRHTEAVETVSQDSTWLGPQIKGIAAGITAIQREQTLQHHAIERLPGGKKALAGALQERTSDSIANASWGPSAAIDAITGNFVTKNRTGRLPE